MLSIPDVPGLGIDLSLDALAEFSPCPLNQVKAAVV